MSGPKQPDGTVAPTGATGLWLAEAADLVATDADTRTALWTADSLALCFPRGWPAVFKQSAVLSKLVNKSMLKGVRCRAIDRAQEPVAAAREAATARGVKLHALHSFSNALAVSEALGFAVVKGFQAMECADGAAGASFVALRHWWNIDASGAWIDLTPPLALSLAADGSTEYRTLLVETPLGDKAPSELTPARQQFASALADRLAKGAASLAPASSSPGHVAPACDVSDATSPAPAAAAAAPAAATAAAAPPKGAGGAAPIPGVSGGAAAKKPAATVDYSRWDKLEGISDDEEEASDGAHSQASMERARQQEELAHEQRALHAQHEEAQRVSAAIDAAAHASAMGNTEALDAMMAHAQQVRPALNLPP